MAKISLDDILEQFRDEARNNRDLGDRFERLILRFFELDPIYADRFDKVWMWNDWPNKGAVGDVGIDLVARDRATGEHVAIQCKFYLPEHTLAKADIDSFFTAMGREQFTSGMIVSTTNKWGKNADDALNHQTKPVTRISVHDLEASPINWSRFDARRPQDLDRKPKHELRPHQQEALDDVINGFKEADRGKLIMACGTGKTFTALRIAEAMAPGGHILVLVPSLSLLSQTLREWTAQATHGIHALAVCSDTSIGKRRTKKQDDTEDITVHDLAFPATTSHKQLAAQYRHMAKAAAKDDANKLTVVFSTYHSIEAVHNAQKAGLPPFDLVICDEAHRTTGVTLVGEDESHFVKVHDAGFIEAAKRLYMTATPRIYGDSAKSKAQEAAAELASMDDAALFGNELHRLGFGEAVSKSLLTDYKVLVLAVDESYVAETFQKQLASKSELNLDDATRITGCWNGLEKRFEALKDAPDLQGDITPMRRAVAFSRTIKDSKRFVQQFHDIVEAYKEDNPDLDILDIHADHVDGSFDALRRNALLDWLKQDSPGNTARILSNARCLSEGVDVPALDTVMFLNPRNSVVDVVQSVGRVMRLAPDKRFGYIILPIGIPADKAPEEALKDNEKYKVVWQVLQILRAHDDRFNATVNQIELNKQRPDNIQVIGVGGGPGDDDGSASGGDGDSKPRVREVQGRFDFPQLDEWKNAIYAKMVKKVGDRAYWATWAADIARIAEKHITRIKALVKDKNAPYAKDFAKFLKSLQDSLNPAVTADEAVEMLAQHLITRPVFDALFAHYAFTEHNPVSQSMQAMLDKLDEQAVSKEAETLDKFYASVRDRAAGLDNAEARQRVVIELYDEFFKNAFPKMAERLGIVYTPVEVVDFIIHSVQDILKSEFDSSLGDKDVHIIDPFTGTGTFLVRLLQSGLISPEDLPRKYANELHANEIVLLAYYIAAINIEETYHGLMSTDEKKAKYETFDGIVLTDTFQLYESKQGQIEGTFPENSKRAKRQQQSPIRVVIANPPYSAQQQSENDNNQALSYRSLDEKIRLTFAAKSAAGNKKNLYDSYVRSIRWATDRIRDRGVVGFVTNGSFIDGNNMDGLRACLTDEYTSLYVFNLRGNQRTSGDLSRREGGKIFGSGSRAPIAITLLVKNPGHKGNTKLHYHDIGDYLSRDEKLGIIRKFASIDGIAKAKRWKPIKPNAEHDWINQRDPAFDNFVPLGDKTDSEDSVFFQNHTQGLLTSRDPWAYNYSTKILEGSIKKTLDYFNKQVRVVRQSDEFSSNARMRDKLEVVEQLIGTDPRQISWSDTLKASVARLSEGKFSSRFIHRCRYRPYCTQFLYYDPLLIHRRSQLPSIFPNSKIANLVICVDSRGSTKDFSALIADSVFDYEFISKGQCFPLYLYEKAVEDGELSLGGDDDEIIDGYRRIDAVTDGILKTFREAFGKKVTKEDIFYYVYGILHSPEYRERFAADLKKMLPRIPLTQNTSDFWAFSKAGRELAEWHLNYETVEPWPVKEHKDTLDFDLWDQFKVKKMTFARPTAEQKSAGEKWDKTRIVYNSHLTISQIPLEAYEYVVNGKPAIEWIMDRYQVTVDKKSGIRNDPNDWCKEHDNPRYIIDLLKRIVRVSIETMRIVQSLPALNENTPAAT
ncbi:MAG: type ISP restriction/modification enzyme [Candidatus Paceibacterota bacterium]